MIFLTQNTFARGLLLRLMLSQQSNAQLSKSDKSKKLSLRLILVIPFVIQIFAAVGLTGYLSLRNGQKAVNDLASRLRKEVSGRIDQHLDSYMTTPRKVVKNTSDTIEIGLIYPKDTEKVTHYLWKQVNTFDVGYILFGLESGVHLASGHFYGDERVTIDEVNSRKFGNTHLYIYGTDDQGNRTKVVLDNGETVVDGEFTLQKEGWYADAVKQGKPVWSEVYNLLLKPFALSIATSRPIYDKNKRIIGVVAVEQQLSRISEFLSELKVSPSGKTFILERNGLLIASSAEEEPFTIVNDKPQRIKAISSKDPLIKATAEHLIRAC